MEIGSNYKIDVLMLCLLFKKKKFSISELQDFVLEKISFIYDDDTSDKKINYTRNILYELKNQGIITNSGDVNKPYEICEDKINKHLRSHPTLRLFSSIIKRKSVFGNLFLEDVINPIL